jgi:hypothetical protein
MRGRRRRPATTNILFVTVRAAGSTGNGLDDAVK